MCTMFFEFITLLIEIIVVVLIILSLYYRYNYRGRLMAKIPSRKGLPVFGDAFNLYLSPDQLFKFLRASHKECGSICQFSGFHIRSVNIFTAEDAEVILSSSRFNEKQLPYTFLKSWLRNGLLVSNGKKWHERRKMLTPAFHFNILKKFSETIREQSEELVDRIQLEVGKRKTDIVPLIVTATLNIMCKTSMGATVYENMSSVANKYLKALHTIGQAGVYRISRPWYCIELLYALTKVAQNERAAVKDLHEFTLNIIKQRRTFKDKSNLNELHENNLYGKKNRMAMLDLLLEQEKLGNIDENGIREEVDTFLFEGHDTSAMALSFMMMRIANEPEAQNKIYEELRLIFGDSQRSPTMDDFNRMKYLELCIKESLRLYPSVPFLARYIKDEVVLSGYRVPSDVFCNIHVFDIHRCEETYPEPDRFIPERFLPENLSKRNPYAYIPFSAGPRNCIGQKFALLQMKTIMSGVLRRYRLEPVTKPEDIVFISDMVLRAKDPIYVQFYNRLSLVTKMTKSNTRDNSNLH